MGNCLVRLRKETHAAAPVVNATTKERIREDHGNLHVFTSEELKVATRNYNPGYILGEGGFGMVYKGRLDKGTKGSRAQMVVAVKKLKRGSKQGSKEWKMEVDILRRLSHPNMVRLLGYCSEENNDLQLVYEFMSKGSLDNHLFRRNRSSQTLSWDVRLNIAICAARGLAFLHGENVIYRDFKTSNILLDEDYNAKISDFGLARNGPTEGSHVSTLMAGTQGYVAPEYYQGQLYLQSDVYSFGVVLMELLTGLRSFDISRPEGD